jgi:hypothetical protein
MKEKDANQVKTQTLDPFPPKIEQSVGLLPSRRATASMRV